MTKKKIIEDMIKHPSYTNDNGKAKAQFFVGSINGWGIACNGFSIYQDNEMPEMNIKSTIEATEQLVNSFFDDYVLLSLSSAIEIDKSVLDTWIKQHRRQLVHQDNRFVIGIKVENGNTAFIVVDAWFLRNQLEYVKNNRIFIEPSRFKYYYDDSIYIGRIYSFSEDFETVKCVTLPINLNSCNKPEADLIIEGGIPKG